MGGEKLRIIRPYLGAFFLALSIVACFFGTVSPLSAQSGELSPGLETQASPETARSDESSIILGEPSPVAPVSGNGSSVFVVLRMVLVLALAALAIYGVVFFVKRLAKPRAGRDPYLKILARVPLGNDSYTAVVSVGPKAWLVGGGSNGVNLISEIDDPETVETMLLDDARRIAEEGTRGLIDFRSLFKRLGGGSREKDLSYGSSRTEAGSLSENLRKQRDRLRGL